MGQKQDFELCIIGGAGHVGLPLGVAFANRGVRTCLFDLNKEWLNLIRAGKFPFREEKGNQELKRALKRGTLLVSETPDVISKSANVLLVIGTPVDEYLNPDFTNLLRTIDSYFTYFRDGQTLILRSTVYPGTSERIQRYFHERGKKVGIAFCPERIVQGKSLIELGKLSQIVSAFDAKTARRVGALFNKLATKIVFTQKPIEAELVKLFSNAWRYIRFAVANQFFMIAAEHNLDYRQIYEAMRKNYPRNKDIPGPGFTAGPCLLKDTMQLAAFNSNNFFLGHSAMLVNEGLPNYIVQRLKHSRATVALDAQALRRLRMKSKEAVIEHVLKTFRYYVDLKHLTLGILGMAFKAESDDSRDSLSYKLRKLAQAEAKRVLCTDVYIKDPGFVSLDTVLAESDILILATPHKQYASISPKKLRGKVVVDIWNHLPRSAQTLWL
ncbi:MAG: nucleotide sugar dehydrogenase [Candidatus Sungbacteria bacterium]|uniref:Nucleotide sugar dehydrogenase n=1 Tax=Candidatus Sungiibacteriota bacterium TaxID=2750080 RepID=A0A931SB42_9BACT|nr:nucleotide sugar dehydrogenase [Candidatus Sungbacteria bacterium]